ncbi:MAG: AAA family ATPase [Spirochaetales bacterium]|nr:AAA family ATPase [Spirochaetales bacterium]
MGKYYVDKTDFVYKMTHAADYYFLSRPHALENRF